MRIDQTDLDDEPGDAQMPRPGLSTPDDPDAAGRDQGKAARSDGLPDSSSASLNPALRIVRATAYRAAVDATYRQYATDPGASKLENLQIHGGTTAVAAQLASDQAHYSVAETTPVIIRNVRDPGYPTTRTVSDQVQTGARGPASGREFDPDAAGGPIQQLDVGKARITSEGVQEVTAHLQRFTGGGPLEAPEQAMLDRLTSVAAGEMEPTSYDLNFYTHELDEASRYAQLGFGPESGADLGSPTMYDVWNDVHTAALEDYRISGTDLFYPGVAP